ncbi:hypothetical protein LINPERPRIM_LOCUS35222 [Linum perenne]
MGHELDLGLHIFDNPNASLQYWLRFDLIGSCTSRIINNNL